MVLHDIGSQAYSRIHDIQPPAQVDTQAQLVMKLLSSRLKRGKDWIKGPLARFDLVLCLFLFLEVASLVDVLFIASDVVCDSANMVKNMGAERVANMRLVWPSTALGSNMPGYPIYEVVLAVRRCLAQLSGLVISNRALHPASVEARIRHTKQHNSQQQEHEKQQTLCRTIGFSMLARNNTCLSDNGDRGTSRSSLTL